MYHLFRVMHFVFDSSYLAFRLFSYIVRVLGFPVWGFDIILLCFLVCLVIIIFFIHDYVSCMSNYRDGFMSWIICR